MKKLNYEEGSESRLRKYYEDKNYNAAFERCIDVMAKLMVKYGPAVLKQLEAERNLISFDAENFWAPVNSGMPGRMKAYQHQYGIMKSGLVA